MDETLEEVHEELLLWAEGLGVKIHGIRPMRLSGRGFGSKSGGLPLRISVTFDASSLVGGSWPDGSESSPVETDYSFRSSRSLLYWVKDGGGGFGTDVLQLSPPITWQRAPKSLRSRLLPCEQVPLSRPA